MFLEGSMPASFSDGEGLDEARKTAKKLEVEMRKK